MVSLLDRRVYALADVDRLLALPAGTARRWIDGYHRGDIHYPPVVRVERTRDEAVTWGEFVEARLLAEFRSRGASMQRLPTPARSSMWKVASWCAGCRTRSASGGTRCSSSSEAAR
jgi:hypothetical protein